MYGRKQVGTILELDHCYTCLLQKFLSLLLKAFHFGNKLLCHLEGFGSCVHVHVLLMASSLIYVAIKTGLDWSPLQPQSFKKR
jgi:hypothetical protein